MADDELLWSPDGIGFRSGVDGWSLRTGANAIPRVERLTSRRQAIHRSMTPKAGNVGPRSVDSRALEPIERLSVSPKGEGESPSIKMPDQTGGLGGRSGWGACKGFFDSVLVISAVVTWDVQVGRGWPNPLP
ncbi:hypothetical protein K239x_52190 [Planctomycetes bacterium K23_9]|uniref:Uncharacterized protein n=1 Tax=Stieleria marina TaxID=1930275 RepID=A0A517P1F2_9BACT|nr:hypothetical protein K239x_52190 [Planctomycetes bacterium K23_9]